MIKVAKISTAGVTKGKRYIVFIESDSLYRVKLDDGSYALRHRMLFD